MRTNKWPEWIPESDDRKPKSGEKVLVQFSVVLRYDDGSTGTYISALSIGEHWGKGWLIPEIDNEENCVQEDREIVAWMPLPEPYRKERYS